MPGWRASRRTPCFCELRQTFGSEPRRGACPWANPGWWLRKGKHSVLCTVRITYWWWCGVVGWGWYGEDGAPTVEVFADLGDAVPLLAHGLKTSMTELRCEVQKGRGQRSFRSMEDRSFDGRVYSESCARSIPVAWEAYSIATWTSTVRRSRIPRRCAHAPSYELTDPIGYQRECTRPTPFQSNAAYRAGVPEILAYRGSPECLSPRRPDGA